MMKYLKTYNESLRDKMQPKSEEEILKGLGKLSPNEMLLQSVVNNYINGIKKAIELGANINCQGEGGYYTPLMVATSKGNKETVEYLIKAGANMNTQNVGGNTALIISVIKGDIDIIKILLNAGADVNIKNNLDETALDKTTDYAPNKTQIVELLKKHGAEE